MGPGWKKTGLIRLALFIPLFLVLASTVSAQSSSCSSFSFSQNRAYTTCVSLSPLSCFLHWTYNTTTGIADIAFRATDVTVASSTTGNWVAWALNPTSQGMIKAQALVAYKSSNGTMLAYTSSVQDRSTTLAESSLSFTVTELSAESSGNQIIIFAKVEVPDNRTSVNQVWQVGPLGSSGTPTQHPITNDHQTSKGTLDFLSGVAQSGGGDSRLRRKNIHGVLNAVSWGTLMPLGFMIARYMRVFKSADPAWFYLHILCQTSAYVVGVAGWGLGLKLGSESAGITYHSHRNIGIALFCLATLQVLALLLRPHKDNKYRWYWNIYHHGVGYLVITLSITNVFKGLDILDPEKKWKTIYIVILIVLASIAVFLEAFTWIIVLRRKKNGEPDHNQKYPYGAAPNGYAVRSQPSV